MSTDSGKGFENSPKSPIYANSKHVKLDSEHQDLVQQHQDVLSKSKLKKIKQIDQSSDRAKKLSPFKNAVAISPSEPILAQGSQVELNFQPSPQVQLDPNMISKGQLTNLDTRLVYEALQELDLQEKSRLLKELRIQNKKAKQIDNALVSGQSGKISTLRSNQKSTSRPTLQSETDVIIRTLTNDQAFGYGTGYLYSRGLLKNLSPPYSNLRINFN